ncbi:unnamed protein product [marine sediment metagenome]|uniref:Uncharacterized protein n=1 Tax=marine sediment metagenome TaxID=412755 RepID=X0ZMM2_9ZZZZ
MALNDIWQVTDIQSVHATRVSNVTHWRQDNSGTLEDSLTAISFIYLVEVLTKWVPLLGADWSSICREFKIVGLTGQAFMKDTTVIGPGTATGETLNPATVAVIAKFTATGSLRGTGVSYISGIVAPYEQRNNLTEEGLVAMDTLGLTLVTPATSGGITFTPMRAAGSKKDPLSTPENPLPDITWPAEPWVLSDERVRLTKLRSRRLTTRC